ncbi:MAG: serine hydrolase [Acidobacteria bacterium]|nr:serine hydrolase [Acidobacteriota bacterium]
MHRLAFRTPDRRLPAAVALFALFGGCSGSEPEPTLDETLAAIVADARDAAGSPGLSAAVAVDGELIWSGASGLADVENGVPATADSVYRIASISKPVAGVALMQLVDRGAVDLDAEVQTYFPAFPEKEHPVTVRHLMTHTSGIRHYNPGEMDMKDHFDTIEAAIEIFKDDPLLFEPSTQYSYSSYAWNIVAGIVENVSGQTFDEYMHENVWGPAGMDATYLEHQGEIVPNRVRQYVKHDDDEGVLNAPFADLSIKWAGGGMISRAPDLVRFALALDAETILSADAHDRMTTPYRLADGTMSEYALGWRISTDDTGTWVAHSGGATGGSTRLLRLPERGVAVAVFSNVQSAEGLAETARRLAEAALEHTPEP